MLCSCVHSPEQAQIICFIAISNLSDIILKQQESPNGQYLACTEMAT